MPIDQSGSIASNSTDVFTFPNNWQNPYPTVILPNGSTSNGFTITTTGAGTGFVLAPSTVSWNPLLKKSINGKLDVLAGFFSQETSALLIPSDKGLKFVPFIDRFGMILLQNDINVWTAFDKAKFYEFVENENVTDFNEQPLTRDEVMKLFSNPNN